MTAESVTLELEDIQSGALHERPSPYVGAYLMLRIDDRADGRELVRRLVGLVASGVPSSRPEDDAWITVAFTYHGLEALGVPQASLDTFAPEFREGMAARAAQLGDVGESSPEHWEKPLGSADVHVAMAILSPTSLTSRRSPPRLAAPIRSFPASRSCGVKTATNFQPGVPHSDSKTESGSRQSKAAAGLQPTRTSGR